MSILILVTHGWLGIYGDFLVISLCTAVRNVDRVTVHYSQYLATTEIFQKVSSNIIHL